MRTSACSPPTARWARTSPTCSTTSPGTAGRATTAGFLVAPQALRPGLLERIEQQTARQQQGEPARIQLKCNAIIDEAIIDALYRASKAGVPIDLWVRGICALRPGLPGLSETIRVRSILGRFLEHSRIYAFGAGDAGRH